MHSSCAAALLTPWARFADAALGSGEGGSSGAGSAPASGGQDPGPGIAGDDIVLGTSAAFTGPSRGLGNELYGGAMAYFSHLNESGGVGGRRVALKLYDDGYQPDPCVQNTLKLMLEDQVFLLFGYVGTPTVTRVLPMLKKFLGARKMSAMYGAVLTAWAAAGIAGPLYVGYLKDVYPDRAVMYCFLIGILMLGGGYLSSYLLNDDRIRLSKPTLEGTLREFGIAAPKTP